MFARALIVLLLILNLGVALWWLGRGEPAAAEPPPQPTDVERLRLWSEAHPGGVEAPPATPAPAAPSTGGAPEAAPGETPVAAAEPPVSSEAAPAAAAQACFAFGPFADAAARDRAQAALRPQVRRLAVREVRGSPSGWRVFLPALVDREAANAAAGRLNAAGFRDHYIMSADDTGAMDIALGRYGSEAAAQRHQAALRAAGFEARAAPVGEGAAPRFWVDVVAAADFDVVAARRALGATRADRIDCTSPPTALG